MNNPLVSVIIPVYKVEEYVEQCVESVISQEYRNIEVILIDDGSPDRCPQICDNLADRDSRILVIHQKNSGPSAARNAGINKAQGEYIIFLDSDDFWASGDCLQQIMEIAMKLGSDDVLVFRSVAYCQDGTIIHSKYEKYESLFSQKSVQEIYRTMTEIGCLFQAPYTKVLHRDFMIKNNLYFIPGLSGEDTEWMIRILRACREIVFCPIQLNYYRRGREGSIVNTTSAKNALDQVKIIRRVVNFNQEYPENPFKEYELAYCAYLWGIALSIMGHSSRSDPLYQELEDNLKKTSFVGEYSVSKKSKATFLCYKVFGIKITSIILNQYVKKVRNNNTLYKIVARVKK